MAQSIEEIINKPKISRTNSVDPTLRLPDGILHSIFSNLTSRDLDHVRLVSKNCHRNTPSYFVFDFDQSLFVHKSRNKFMDWVHSSLEICKSKLINADKRILRVEFNYSENIHKIMRLMDENNFHEVYLRFGNYLCHLSYMFQSTCLTLLHLTHCTLIHQEIFHSEVIINSLQELKLDGVKIFGKVLSKFISKYPNIRDLSLVNCKFLTSIVLPKLDRLKKLYVKSMCSYLVITNVQVIAPSLQVFHFVYRSQKKRAVNMDIRACRMLREFHLDCLKFPVGLDHEICCLDFPLLETLLMGPCVTSNTVKISSPLFRTLILFFTRLSDCSRTRVVSAPNLSTYEYVGTTYKPFLDPSDAPNLLETRIGLAYNVEKINRAWFIKLRSHLKDFSNKMVLTLCILDEDQVHEHHSIRKQTSFSPGKGGNLWSKLIGRAPTHPLLHIKHVLLDMNKLKSSHDYMMKYIIDSLFWMSHPHTLTLSIPYRFVALANEVHEELKSRKEGNCCSDNMDKCWSHFLKDFGVHETMTSEKDKLMFVFKFTWQFWLVRPSSFSFHY